MVRKLNKDLKDELLIYHNIFGGAAYLGGTVTHYVVYHVVVSLYHLLAPGSLRRLV